jgi:hypothetical protein
MFHQTSKSSIRCFAFFLLCTSSSSTRQETPEKDVSSNVTTKSIPLQKQYVPHLSNGKLVAYKTAYFGEVNFGTPGQTFTAVFDTGSGHVLIPRSHCTSEACTKHRRYWENQSSTAKSIKHDGTPLTGQEKERDQVVVSFGTGKVTGEFVEDKMCIGDSSGCFTMRVVLAMEMTEDPFSHFEFDGVVGLGLDSIRLNPKFSFFGEMIRENPQMAPQFSVFLSRHEDGASTITFGGHDKEKASSSIEWAPIAMPEHGHWQVQIKQIRIGNDVLEECEEGDCRAVVDTGTSLLGVPRLATRNMHRLLARPVKADGQDPDSIDCRTVPGHSIDFDLGDTVVSVPVEDYSRPQPINMTTSNNGTSLICRSLLLPTDMGPPLGPKLFILGEPFLRRYMTIYDLEQKRIGFTLARQTEFPIGPPVSIGLPPAGSLLIGAPLPPRANRTGSSEPPSTANRTQEEVVL